MDSHLIPDGYLAAMENLEVDEAGVIHSLPPPAAGAVTLDRLVNYCGCPVWQDFTVSYLSSGTKVNNSTTLASGDSFVPDGDVYEAGAGYDWTIYLNRLYYNIGNILRYSGVSKAYNAATWTGRNIYNYQAYPFVITHLQPMQSGLYVMGYGEIARMTEPNVGSISEVYYGPRTPVSDGVSSYILNNGSSIVYCASDGVYMFGGQGDPQKIDQAIALPSSELSQFFIAEYKNRVWVMRGTGGLYAMNKTTGFWEYYNTATMVSGQTFWKLGWPRTQMTTKLDLYSGTFNGSTPWYNFSIPSSATTRMPWTFTTKDFTPSFDAYTRAVHIKFFYLGQTGASTVATIQLYADGALIDTVTQEMLGSGLLHKDYDVAATLANSFHLVVTGTGKADIIDAGIEFTVRHKGDPNA
jgi:hypothetical protein